MIGVIVGIQLIQRMISPAVDTLKQSVIGRTAGAIPEWELFPGHGSSTRIGSAD